MDGTLERPFPGGASCSNGQTCALWYPAVDQDGFGDPSMPRVGCDAPNDVNGTSDKELRDGLGNILICTDCKEAGTCTARGSGNYFTFGFQCSPSSVCGAVYSQGFKGNRPCGTKGTLYRCGNQMFSCANGVTTTDEVEERCR